MGGVTLALDAEDVRLGRRAETAAVHQADDHAIVPVVLEVGQLDGVHIEQDVPVPQLRRGEAGARRGVVELN